MSLFARAKHILLTPEKAWREIEREKTPVVGLIAKYALPLASIARVAYALAVTLFDLRAQAALT